MQTGGLWQYSNKAGYPASPVAFGWAGAVKEKVTGIFGQVGLTQKSTKTPKIKKGDRPTNPPMDGKTKQGGVA